MKRKLTLDEDRWELFDYITDACYAIDHDDIFLYANPTACKFWGKKKEDIVGYHVDIVFPQAKGSVLEEKRKECQRSGKPLTAEFYFPSSPYEGWYEINHSPFPNGIITRFKLIHEKQKASVSIDFLYELISLMLKQLQEPVIIIDMRYKIKECNDFLLTFAGFPTKSSIIGKDFFQTFFEGKNEDLLPIFEKVFRFNKSLSTHQNNLELTISTIMDYFDHPLYYIIFMNKLEENNVETKTKSVNHLLTNTKKSVNQELIPRPTRNFYHDLWNQSGVPTAFFDSKGDLLTVNQAMNDLFLNQINLKYNLLNDPSITWETRNKIKNNQEIHAEKYLGAEEAGFFFMNKTGTIKKEYFLEVIIKPYIATESNTIQGYILKINDRLDSWKKEVSRTKLLEVVLEKMKLSTETFKESVHSLLLFTKTQEDKKFLTKSLKDQKQNLKSMIQEMALLQQLAMDNKETKLSWCDLNTFIQKVTETCLTKHKENGVQIDLRLSEKLPPLNIDIIRYTQVFHNICEILVEELKAKHINITTEVDSKAIRVMFESEHLRKEKYQTAILNLEICQKIIKQQKAKFDFAWNDTGKFTCQIEFSHPPAEV